MNAPWPRGVLFDLDGTLVDSVGDIAGALNELLAEEGLEPFALPEVRAMIGHGVARLVERGFAARERALDPDGLAARVGRMVALYEPRATRETRLMPGAESALESCGAAGMGMAVATNKPVGIARAILDRLGVGGRFGAVVGDDGTLARKPDPAMLRLALERLGLDPADAVMVGDGEADVAAARNAGMPVVLVGNGYARSAPSSLGADMVIPSLAELGRALGELGAAIRAGAPSGSRAPSSTGCTPP